MAGRGSAASTAAIAAGDTAGWLVASGRVGGTAATEGAVAVAANAFGKGRSGGIGRGFFSKKWGAHGRALLSFFDAHPGMDAAGCKLAVACACAGSQILMRAKKARKTAW